MSGVPSRTDAQRAEALQRALEARRERARLRAALREGTVTAVQVIEGAAENPTWASLRVVWLLESLPRIGPVRAERIMTSLAIASSRRIQGLGDRQRAGLIAALGGTS